MSKNPRIAYEIQRDGTKRYYVEVYRPFAVGNMWEQESKKTTSLKTARKYLKEMRDKEIVEEGVIDDE